MATSETPFKIRGLTKRYSETTVFKQLSLDIAPGEYLNVIGLNRAGKTTNIHMRLGLTAPDAGSISYFSGSAGKAVMQMPHDALTTKDTPRSKYGDTLWCGCAALVSGPGAIPAGNMQRIRRYTRLAVNPVATMQQVHHHLSAAVERMARVFLIDQALGHFAKLDRHDRSAFGLDRRARHAGQNALAFLRQIGMNADPTVPDHGRLIPYFF